MSLLLNVTVTDCANFFCFFSSDFSGVGFYAMDSVYFSI